MTSANITEEALRIQQEELEIRRMELELKKKKLAAQKRKSSSSAVTVPPPARKKKKKKKKKTRAKKSSSGSTKARKTSDEPLLLPGDGDDGLALAMTAAPFRADDEIVVPETLELLVTDHEPRVQPTSETKWVEPDPMPPAKAPNPLKPLAYLGAAAVLVLGGYFMVTGGGDTPEKVSLGKRAPRVKKAAAKQTPASTTPEKTSETKREAAPAIKSAKAAPKKDAGAARLAKRAERVARSASEAKTAVEIRAVDAELAAIAGNDDANGDIQEIVNEARAALLVTRGALKEQRVSAAKSAAETAQFEVALAAIDELTTLDPKGLLGVEMKVLKEQCETGLAQQRKEAAQQAAADALAVQEARDAEQAAQARKEERRVAGLAKLKKDLRKRAKDWFSARDAGKLRCKKCKGETEVTCSTCDGTLLKRCKDCSGQGWVWKHNGQALGQGRRQRFKADCLACPGWHSGKVNCTVCSRRGKLACETCNEGSETTPGFRSLTTKRAFWDVLSPEGKAHFDNDRDAFMASLTRGKVLRDVVGPSLGVEVARVQDVELRGDHALVTADVVWGLRRKFTDEKLRKARYERDTKVESTYTTRWIRNGGKWYLATRVDKGEPLDQ